MHNTHPSIIDQNSRLLSQSAKLSCMLNDISAKFESLMTQSAPEQVIWVWEIASSGVRRAGRYIRTPQPISYEKAGTQFIKN